MDSEKLAAMGVAIFVAVLCLFAVHSHQILYKDGRDFIHQTHHLHE